jgi:hypothetical protein
MSVHVAKGLSGNVISVEFINYDCSLKSALYHISWWFNEK